MKLAAITLTMIFVSSLFAQEPNNVEKCEIEHQTIGRLKDLLDFYKKDCGQYPKKLTQLLENKPVCKHWGHSRKGPYVEDTPDNRKMLTGFSYRQDKNNYTLLPMDCPI